MQALTQAPAQPGSAPPQPEVGLLAKEVTNSSSQRFKQWSDGSRYTGYETPGLGKGKASANKPGDSLGKSTGAAKSSPMTRSQTVIQSRQTANSAASTNETTLTGGSAPPATGARKVHAVAVEGRVNQDPSAPRSAKGFTQGGSIRYRHEKDNTLTTGYVQPGAGTVQSLVSNHGDFSNSHGDSLGENAMAARPSPMTRPHTVTKQIPLHNDGSCRVRGLAEGIALMKARYAREYEGTNTTKRGSLPAAKPPVRSPSEGRNNTVTFTDTRLSQNTVTGLRGPEPSRGPGYRGSGT